LDLSYPELFTIPAADGYPMPAYLYKPKTFDPSRAYPLIIYTYGGPSSRSVTDQWDFDRYWNNVLANSGFLVACFDNRSATGVSKTDENTINRMMTGDGELSDLLDGVNWLKSQPYVDRARVGIWGWSNGGMMTLLGMTRSVAFKAGISVAPVTDWTYYDTIWAETVMKTPQENPEGYLKTNLCQRAKDLSGRLLLVHGTYDDNVHIQNSWHFVHELVLAGKMFDLMIYPMRQHSIADHAARVHLYNRMLEFWKVNL
jgi:dipeptidyl-peptidase-4